MLLEQQTYLWRLNHCLTDGLQAKADLPYWEVCLCSLRLEFIHDNILNKYFIQLPLSGKHTHTCTHSMNNDILLRTVLEWVFQHHTRQVEWNFITKKKKKIPAIQTSTLYSLIIIQLCNEPFFYPFYLRLQPINHQYYS